MLGSPPLVAATCRSRQTVFFLAGGGLPEVVLIVLLIVLGARRATAAQAAVGLPSASGPTSTAERARTAADLRMFADGNDDSTARKITSASGSSPEKRPASA